MIDFQRLVEAKCLPEKYKNSKILGLDPGHTTGWALFTGSQLTSWGQADTVINRSGNNEGELDWGALMKIFQETSPDIVVCEDYRVYPHKLERHTNSRVLTLHLIGAIELHCWWNNIPLDFAMASMAKGFVTDDKLKAWGFYQPNMRHSRDAIRHCIYEVLFTLTKNK